MAYKTWDTLKIRYCDHSKAEVGLEVEAVYPSEWLPDQAPRLHAHRCSNGVLCSLSDKASCVWSGTNPDYDPFQEPSQKKP